MKISEFNNILHKLRPGHPEPSVDSYKTIDFVYRYHPSIKDKETIVKLWADYGYRVICDMAYTALKECDVAKEERYTAKEGRS